MLSIVLPSGIFSTSTYTIDVNCLYVTDKSPDLVGVILSEIITLYFLKPALVCSAGIVRTLAFLSAVLIP